MYLRSMSWVSCKAMGPFTHSWRRRSSRYSQRRHRSRASVETPERLSQPWGWSGWQRILRSTNDAFPAEPPRPVAPDLLLRTFNVPTSTATHVKLVVTSNQCTGNGDFHGEQDQDPNNETDCRATAIANQVRVAELQLLSDRPAVEGAKSVD